MKILLLLYFALQLKVSLHDVPIATFQIQQDGQGTFLQLSLDAEDLADEIKRPADKITKSVLQQYLNTHTRFSFNNQQNELLVTDVNRSADHFQIKARFKNHVTNLKKLEITNTCLLTVAKQSNIMLVDLNQTTKDFRMHHQRQKITVNY